MRSPEHSQPDGSAPDWELFAWSREPDPAWQRRLDEIAPPADRLTYLTIAWEPGTPEQPVQRWIVYEAWPEGCAPFSWEEFVQAIESPEPEPLRWTERGVPITRTQYLLCRKHGRYMHPVWVVQGDRGGHMRFLTHPEYTLFRLAMDDDEAEWPAPGSQAYAEPDERTYRQLIAHDRMRAEALRLAFSGDMEGWERSTILDARGKTYREVLDEQRERLNVTLALWLEDQCGLILQHAQPHELTAALDGAPEGPGPDEAQVLWDWQKER